MIGNFYRPWAREGQSVPAKIKGRNVAKSTPYTGSLESLSQAISDGATHLHHHATSANPPARRGLVRLGAGFGDHQYQFAGDEIAAPSCHDAFDRFILSEKAAGIQASTIAVTSESSREATGLENPAAAGSSGPSTLLPIPIEGRKRVVEYFENNS